MRFKRCLFPLRRLALWQPGFSPFGATLRRALFLANYAVKARQIQTGYRQY